MLEDAPIKVGDELVEYGKVYKVVRIEEKMSYDGKLTSYVFFAPVYITADNKTVNCAVPLSNIAQANIRRPLDKEKITQILDFSSNLKIVNDGEVFDVTCAREVLKRNDPEASAQVLKWAWKEIKKDQEGATKSKKDMLTLSIQNLAQEVALAFDLTLEGAEEKLHKALKKATP